MFSVHSPLIMNSNTHAMRMINRLRMSWEILLFQLRGQGRFEDILERHHKNNGCPSAFNPALLAHCSQPAMASKVWAPCNSKRLKDVLLSPDNLGFYHTIWKDCLEDAKKECRAAHALDNLFSSKACDLSRPWPSATLINAFPSPQHHSRAHKLNPETLHSFPTQNARSWSRSITPDLIGFNPTTCTYLSLALVSCLSLPLIHYPYLSLVPSVWHS